MPVDPKKKAGQDKVEVKGRGDITTKDPEIKLDDMRQETTESEIKQEDPEEILKRLRVEEQAKAEAITSNESQMKELQTGIKKLQTDIRPLEEKVSNVKKVVNGYGETLSNFEKEKKDMEIFFKTKTYRNEMEIKRKKEVDDKIEKVDKEIQAKEEQVSAKKREFDTAQADYEKAKQTLNETQNVFDTLTTLKQGIEQNLKELMSLKGSIQKAEEGKKPAEVYFLIKELDKILRDPKPSKTNSQLQSALYEVLDKLNEAKGELSEKEGILKGGKTAFEDKQKELRGSKKDRRNKILGEINSLEKK